MVLLHHDLAVFCDKLPRDTNQLASVLRNTAKHLATRRRSLSFVWKEIRGLYEALEGDAYFDRRHSLLKECCPSTASDREREHIRAFLEHLRQLVAKVPELALIIEQGLRKSTTSKRPTKYRGIEVGFEIVDLQTTGSLLRRRKLSRACKCGSG